MARSTQHHFNEIAESYKNEIPLHIRDHLLNKLWKICSPYLFPGCKVIDIGCGDGTNTVFFKEKRFDITGIDFSEKLIQQGCKMYPEIKNRMCVGDCLNLNFKNNTFDVALMIGVLHHIPTREEQFRAVKEALRLIKKDGILIIRESNLVNPFFRLFWNYVFPITDKIDCFGGENWIPSEYFADQFHESKVETIYLTFIPSFLPKFLLPLAGRLEEYLENSIFKTQSAHYVTILKAHDR